MPPRPGWAAPVSPSPRARRPRCAARSRTPRPARPRVPPRRMLPRVTRARDASRSGRRCERRPGGPGGPASRGANATLRCRRPRAASAPPPQDRVRPHVGDPLRPRQAQRGRARRGPRPCVVVGRPSALRTRYIPMEASTMSAAPASTPGRWACETRFPLPFSVPCPPASVRRKAASAAPPAATAMSNRMGRSMVAAMLAPALRPDDPQRPSRPSASTPPSPPTSPTPSSPTAASSASSVSSVSSVS